MSDANLRALIAFGGTPIFSEDAYAANLRQIEQAQAFLDGAKAKNEEGYRNYLANDLKRKIQEVEETRQALAALENTRPLLTGSEASTPHASPAPSARIEEVQSPDRLPNAHQPNPFYQVQANYVGGYHQQPQGYGASWSNPFPTQNVQHASSSTLHSAQPQTHRYSNMTQTQPQTSSMSRSSGATSQAQTYAHTQQSAPPTSQSNSGQQTQSRSQSYPQQNVHQTQMAPPRPQAPPHSQSPMTVNPSLLQLQPQPQSHPLSSASGAAQRLDERIFQSQEQPRTSNPQLQTQRQPSAPPLQSQSRPSASSAPNQPTRSNSRPAQSQTSTLPPTQSNSRPPASQPPPTVAATQPNPQVHSQQSQASQRVSMDTPKTSTPAAQAPSYGISPFAHNPTVKTQPNPLGVPPAQQPVASNAQRPPPASNAGPIPAAPNTTVLPGKGNPPASVARAHDPGLQDFKTLITKWQRASPPKSYMDVPDADLRIMKFPSGEIHFLHPIGGQAARIPVDVAYKRVLRFLNSMVGIYVNPKGVNVLLRLPLPPAQDAVYKEFVGVPAKDAPTVIFPTPPPMGAKLNGPAHTGRTPKDADKRFLAHDILRALGKHTFAGDDDRVRYAKRRALEPPEEAEEPLVLQRISSNEPSAKSTSASASSSRSTSPLPAVPVPPLPFQRLPLFMPPDRSVQVQVVQPIPVPVPVPVQQQRVPLFLPSDSSVPPRLAQPKPQPRPQPQPRHRSPDVFVLIPPAPPHVRRDLEKMRARRDQEAMTVDAAPPPKPEPEIDIKELKRQRALGMYQNTENEAEVGAMLEACTRLREVPCKWFDCGSVLNSLENLITHLHEIHAQEDEDSTTCFWDICGESFASSAQLALHAEMHVLSSIPCAYQDCDGVFSSPRELVAHNNLRHAEQNSLGVEGPVLLRLLPSTRLGVPEEASLPLPPVPERVPLWEASYVQSFPKEVLESESGTLLSCPTLAPDVQMPNIPHDRHMSLGPWVARNIAAPALHAKRYNAAHKMKVPYEPDYEFVETSLKHYSSLPSRPARVREMAELKSKEVSELIEKGQIVLWPPEDGAELPFEEEFIVDEKKDELELEEGEERMDGRNAVEEGSTSSTVVEKPIVDEKKDEPEEPMDEKNAVEEGSTSSTVVEKPFEDVALPSAPVLPKTLDEWGDGMLEVSTNPLLAVPSDEEMVENMLQDLEGPSL